MLMYQLIDLIVGSSWMLISTDLEHFVGDCWVETCKLSWEVDFLIWKPQSLNDWRESFVEQVAALRAELASIIGQNGEA